MSKQVDKLIEEIRRGNWTNEDAIFDIILAAMPEIQRKAFEAGYRTGHDHGTTFLQTYEPDEAFAAFLQEQGEAND